MKILSLLGAKVGKRVYWPGSGLDIVEYDLLEVGDDVVFGSRSVVLTSSAVRSAPVKFESGSMVADRYLSKKICCQYFFETIFFFSGSYFHYFWIM